MTRASTWVALAALALGCTNDDPACLRSDPATMLCLSCKTGLRVCSGRCVDATSDLANCGSCGHACVEGTRCEQSRCLCDDAQQTLCTTRCVDTSSDPTNCGGCGIACGAGTCVEGRCACADGATLCSRVCVNLQTSNLSCGACAHACVGGSTCLAGRCVCQGAHSLSCQNVCFDGWADHAHCGSCDSACADSEECVGGECVPRAAWPPFGARLGTRTPTFRWHGADASVEVCADRACAQVAQRIAGNAAHRATASRLDPGVYFWRLRSAAAATPTPVSVFRIDARDVDTQGLLPSFADLNGDGLADVVVGSVNPMRLSIYSGAGGVLSTTPFRELGFEMMFGDRAAVRAAGDLDADSYGDLSLSFGGRLVTVSGAPAGPGTLAAIASADTAIPALDLNDDGLPDWLMVREAVTYAGYAQRAAGATLRALNLPHGEVDSAALAQAGDVDGDGFPDVAVGAPDANPPRAYVYFGSSTGVDRSRVLPPTAVSAGYGRQIACAGDVNGDGYADLLAGLGTQGAAVYLGGRASITLQRTLLAPAGVEVVVYPAGDLDRDGYSDLVAVPRGRDEVWLYRGSAAGVVETPTVSTDARWRDVEAVSAAGDIDGDGYDDLVAGVPSQDRAYVFHGGAEVFTRVEELRGADGTEFGRALP